MSNNRIIRRLIKKANGESIDFGSTVEILNGNYKGQKGEVTDIEEDDDQEGNLQFEVTLSNGTKRYLGIGDIKEV